MWKSFRVWLGSLPQPWRSVYRAVGFAACLSVLDLVISRHTSISQNVLAGLLFATGMILVDWWGQRREKTRDNR